MIPSEFAKGLCVLGQALIEQAQTTQEGEWLHDAIVCYEDAMDADPDLIDPYLALAQICLYQQNAQSARAFLLKAQALDPFDDVLNLLWESLKIETQE